MKSIIDQRNTDFINLCSLRLKNLRSQGRNASIEDVVDYVLMRPAPRYYTDGARLFTNVQKILAGEKLTKCSALNKELYADLVRDLQDAQRCYPDDSLRINLMRLTAGLFGRPKFYISRKQALMLAKHVFSYKVA